ncbi:hypothetical protein SPSYN_02074 [Sporotomaculum syntrophicum]|uniref:Uncharacterized protein n=1 Tax=Sporotomaculum syntrophicum TaxID=182264 RepID=A0A9D3AY20_9FIRM|nr:hypothetical protein [Sporotomaculum syntrophicum]KAF1084298.1 hypothetical protein SPSYN_02074 [Sporotomaculum syntrophicum]
MKKQIVLGAFVFLFITNIIFISTTVFYKTKIDEQVFKVYSFEAESTDIKINDGLVIILPNKQIVNGGKMQYVGNKQENIQSYSKTIYLNKQGNKEIVLSNAVSVAGASDGTAFSDVFLLNKNIGEISSEKLFSPDDINIINDNLYFSLDYSTINREKGNITIKLNVKEFNC